MRSVSQRFGVLAVAAAIIGTGWIAGTATVAPAIGQEAPGKGDKNLLRTFMRKKLEACSQILEGITTEDAALVKSGADTLATMSAGEQWRVSNDLVYRQFSDEFQRTAKKLTVAAEKGNFDDVTLKWIDATLSCVECHKFVRGMRLANSR